MFIIVVASCSEDETPQNCDYEREWNDFNAKLDVFSDNLTITSCNSLRQSAIVLLNRLDRCPGVVDTRTTIEQWRDLDCSAFGN